MMADLGLLDHRAEWDDDIYLTTIGMCQPVEILKVNFLFILSTFSYLKMLNICIYVLQSFSPWKTNQEY